MFGDQQVTREILGDLPTWLVSTFYTLVAIAFALAAYGFWLRHRLHRQGRPSAGDRFASDWQNRIKAAGVYMTFQKQLLRDFWAGVAHLLVFYGFVILFIGTCLVFLEHKTPLHFFYGWFYKISSLIIDLGGLAFIVGLGMFLWRRHFGKTDRLLRTWWVGALTWLLMLIGLSGFFLEASRIAIDFPPFERWSLVGYLLACGLEMLGVTSSRALEIYRFAWAFHAAVCVVFFALLPWRFFSHMVYGLLGWTRRKSLPLATLATQPLQVATSPGATRWNELTSYDLMQTDACVTCGRCNQSCPAAIVEKPLRPRDIVLGIRAAMNANDGSTLDSWVSDQALWSCTTCGACNDACPAGISVFDKIIELRRGRVESGEIPIAAENVFNSTALDFNPFNKRHSDRMLWTNGLPVRVAEPTAQVEVLYWIGCSGSFDPDGQSISKAMIRILNHLEIDYHILGACERCTGDPARRMGEEGLFQELARHNIRSLSSANPRTIVTQCPHCFNILKNEYPQLMNGNTQQGSSMEPSWRVVHHTQFLAEMLSAGRLSFPHADESSNGSSVTADRASSTITYHDPCYLARGNDEVSAPRQLLTALPDSSLVEMPRNRKGALCCGAGGGSMWLDVAGQQRIENLRFAEAAATGGKTIVTACPFCKGMLNSASQSNGDSHEDQRPAVRDVAEMIADSMRL